MTEYIEREVLMKDCKSMIDEVWNSKTAPVSWSYAYAEFLDNVERVPAADVAPVVHGEWLLRHEGYGHYWECSVCHTNPCIYVTEHTKFCPNCGAKMDGGADHAAD